MSRKGFAAPKLSSSAAYALRTQLSSRRGLATAQEPYDLVVIGGGL